MTERFSTKKLVLSALFVALVYVATMPIHIPTSGTDGYIHPGDAIMTLCGVLLGSASTFLVAGIDPCMADLLGGYFIYVPITFAIKDLVAFSASHACRSLRTRGINPHATVAGHGVIDIVLMVGGYHMCEVFLCGLDIVLASVPSNITQGISGLIISSALYPALQEPLSIASRT